MDAALIRRDLDALARRDRDLRRGLRQVGYPPPRIREPGFEALLATIVSQQISTGAAAAIMARLREMLPSMQPCRLLALPPGSLRAAGLSRRKIEYAEALARALEAGEFDPAELETLNDAEAIAAITALHGFGRWSAEIYLMFSLRRRDLFPAGDLALRVGLQKLKGFAEPLDEQAARVLVEDWSPYRSAGSLFLWHYYRGAPA